MVKHAKVTARAKATSRTAAKTKAPVAATKVAAGAGIATRTSALGKVLEDAMAKAITDAAAEGINDPVKVKARMMVARRKVRDDYYAAQGQPVVAPTPPIVTKAKKAAKAK